jgi:hypothetical protein
MKVRKLAREMLRLKLLNECHLRSTRIGGIMTHEMTLLEAVESLALMEFNAVSFVHVVPLRSSYVAFFSFALLLPFLDTDLSEEFRAGEPRLWPDQARLLESEVPIEDQIVELHRTGYLGNLSRVYLRPTKRVAGESWIIQTHCETDQERLAWMEAVIVAEGRSPWRENRGQTASTLRC